MTADTIPRFPGASDDGPSPGLALYECLSYAAASLFAVFEGSQETATELFTEASWSASDAFPPGSAEAKALDAILNAVYRIRETPGGCAA